MPTTVSQLQSIAQAMARYLPTTLDDNDALRHIQSVTGILDAPGIDEGEKRSLLGQAVAYGGVNRKNWMHYAGRQIQSEQEERRQLGALPLTARQQVEIQNRYRQLVGEKPVVVDPMKQYAAKRAESIGSHAWYDPRGNVAANLLGSYAQGAGAFTSLGVRLGEATGLADEGATADWAREKQRFEQTLAPQGGASGVAGQLAGQAALMLTLGGAGGTKAGALAELPTAAAFGGMAAGQTIEDVALRREAGEDISGGQELTAALGNALVETVTELVGQKAYKLAGRSLAGRIPTIGRAVKAMDATGTGKAILSALSESGLAGNLAVGGLEEAASQIGQNLISKVYKETETLEGVGEAFRGGVTLAGVMAPVSAATQLAGQRTQDGPGEGPGAVPTADVSAMEAPAQPGAGMQLGTSQEQTQLLEHVAEIAQDKDTPDWLKNELAAEARAAEAEDRPPDFEGVLEGARARLTEEAEGPTQTAPPEAPGATISPETTQESATQPEAAREAPTAPESQEVREQRRYYRKRLAGTMRATREAKAEARTDELTQIANRKGFTEQVETMRQKGPDRPMSIGVVDVSNFKALNDTMGHEAGDEALRVIAKTIRKELRVEGKRARPGDVLATEARTGGDEFAIALVADEAGAQAATTRVTDAVNKALVEAGLGEAAGKAVTIDIGVSQLGQGEALSEAMARADETMYETKVARKQARGEALAREEAPAAEAEPEGAAEKPRGTKDLFAAVAEMKEKGATDQDVMDYLREQDIRLLPASASRVAKGEDVYIRETSHPNAAVGNTARRLGLQLVKPATEREAAIVRAMKRRGVTVSFFTDASGKQPSMAIRGKRQIMIRAGQYSGNAIWDVVFHEAAHALKMDALEISDQRVLDRAAAEYLDQVDSDEYRQILRDNPEQLRQEAAAWLIGQAAKSLKVRRRLLKTNPGLIRRAWEALVQTAKKLLGADTTLDEIIRQWDWRAPIDKESASLATMLRFGPKGDQDAESFMADLADVMKESPKTTGQPLLANPMDSETNRRLMDKIDESLKAAGRPERQKEATWRAKAKKMLGSKSQRKTLDTAIRRGGRLTAVETVAGQQILRDAGDAVFAKPTMKNILAVQELAIGWRRGGTETARAMRARHDQIKKPGDRLREFAVAGLSGADAPVGEKAARLMDKGQQDKAKELLSKHARKVMALIEKWKKAGIDLSSLDDATAADVRVASAIASDLARLNYGAGAWDVIHEIRRNMLMYSPLTLMRNLMGGLYAAADIAVVKPLARSLEGLVRNTSGETTAALHAAGSKVAWSRAIGNAMRTMMFEVPQLELGVEIATGKGVRGIKEKEIYSSVAIRGDRIGEALGKATNPLIGGIAAKTVNVLGRLVRAPQAINAAVDELVKTLHIHSEIAAHAVKAGKQIGLKPGTAEMAEFVDKQLTDLASDSWQAAIDSGETWRTTFQAKASAFEKIILDLRKAPGVGNVVKLLVPFAKTPVQLGGQALMHVPVIGATRMARRAIEGKRGGKPYTKAEFARHAAQQIIGILGMAALWNLVPDDDEKDGFVGPASYARKHRGERVTSAQQRQYMTFRLRGKDYTYNWIEPFSQWLGTSVAVIDELKQAEKSGREPGEVVGRLWHRLAGMYADQTYIRTVGDLVRVYYDPELYGERAAASFLGSWTPNIIDSAMRDADPYIRERRVVGEKGERATLGRQVLREMFPTGQLLPPPKVDFFGNEITVPGQQRQPTELFTIRLLSPIQPRYAVKGKHADVIRTIVNWNAKRPASDPETRWFQEPYRKVSVKYPQFAEPVREDLSAEEYHDYCRLSGLLAAKAFENVTLNVDNPTRRDMAIIERVFRDARNKARGPFKRARQAKALGRASDYRAAIDIARKQIQSLAGE